MEGGPFQQEWWFEEAKGFVPYLNVTARWEGAPDQGLLSEKGGRGFPYCAIMNADGEVIWEVRPTSREVLRTGLADARMLQDLKDRLAEKPEDAALAASVEVFAAMGCQQRETKSVEALEKLAATEGLDAKVAERFGSWMAAKRFDDKIAELGRNTDSQEEYQKKILALYEEGTRPPEGANRAISFWIYTVYGAIAEGKKEIAVECLAKLDEMAKSEERLKKTIEDLRKKLDEIG